MSLLWTGMCRIYLGPYTDTSPFWCVDNGDAVNVVKCPRVVMTGSFKTVVATEQKAEPRAWLCFSKASVYRQSGGIVSVTAWIAPDSHNRVQQ
jgi:hypothetical protein